ncbi:MAG: hypothetical protein QW270_00160 [Candidatus Bathyarchaeia archaeon]
MNAKKLVISVLTALALTLTFSSMAKCTIPIVKVAVYFESANIDANEKQKILGALGVVENRFETQIGVAEPDFDEKGTWTSDKTTEDPDLIFIDAIRKTGGPSEGYTAAVFFVDQPLTEYYWPPGYVKDIWAVASPVCHACLVRYDGNDDKLRALIQWALSWTFGTKECDESWCVMNPEYMPHEIWWGPIKIGEDWAEEWGPDCKQKLIDTYNGGTFTYTKAWSYWVSGGFVYGIATWTEEYHQWSLTKLETKHVVGWLSLSPPSKVAAHPTFTDSARIYFSQS